MDTFVDNVIYTHCVQWRIHGTQGGPFPGRHKFFTHRIPIIDGLYDVLNSPRQLESVFKQLKSFCFWGRGPPDPVSVKIKIFSFQSFDIDSYMDVSMSMFFLEPRFNEIYVGFKYAPKG